MGAKDEFELRLAIALAIDTLASKIDAKTPSYLSDEPIVVSDVHSTYHSATTNTAIVIMRRQVCC